MGKRKLKPFVVPTLYFLGVVSFIVSVFLLQRIVSGSRFKDQEDFEYVIDNIFDEDIPVVSDDDVILRPYTDGTVKIVKHYYDYQGEKDKQQNSLIYYEKTYMQNSGVDYKADTDKFDIIAILDGTVLEVEEDEMLGKTIQIRHGNDMISSYQCLSETFVVKDDVISAGDLIAKSGTCNIMSDLKDHLHFELFYKGKVVNPEEYYDKKISDL